MARRCIAFRRPPPLFLAALLLLVAVVGAFGRSISLPEEGLSLSDGISSVTTAEASGILSLLIRPRSSRFFAAEQCEQTYGFLPCTTTVLGNLFLVITYGFMMYKAATYLSSGSELLLEILGPGIVGGLLLPILGALPDAMLIFVSGLSGSKETAQNQVLIGMGLLAGSTVMLLTILWGTCIVVGKSDLSENSTSIDGQDTKVFDLFGSGVTTDRQTSYAARIMAISIIPFLIVQLPKMFKFSGQRLAVLMGLIASAALVVSYCLYQVFQPWIQKRRLAYAKHKHVISGILRHAQMEALGRLMNDDGTPNPHVIRKLFRKLDLDSDGALSRSELTALIIGIQIDEIDLDRDDAVDRLMDEFDRSHNNAIEEDEFVAGISKWLNEAKHSNISNSGAYSKKFMHEFHKKTKDEHDMLLDMSDEVVEDIENPTWMTFKAVVLLILGTALAAAFADPLVDAVDNFSIATSIPSFFISFIAMPLATNSSEAVSAIIFASRKKQRTSSLTFSEIYGGATMNNTLCLAVFLSLVYARDLNWDFSSEVLIIFLVCTVMGLFTSFRTTFPLWTCFVAYLLYPITLILIYILDFIFGWS